MTKNLDIEGLKSIVNDYDLFFIDIWGVIHNGIKLHEKAIKTLIEIEKAKKEYVLLTNAPRPNNTVKIFLAKMGMTKNIQEKVYTSGEAALSYLKKNHLNESFYHIGPPRDFVLFIDFKKKKNRKY
jgi:ribonucleotide monophosphatase NagD (HAD superfamily)